MKTYQDLIAVGAEEKARMEFILAAIREHKSSGLFQTAREAVLYDQQRNVTITTYQKLLYTLSGEAVPDNYSANHKVASNFFNRFTTQENQYLLGNGVTLEKEGNKKALGQDFDTVLQQMGRDALVQGVSFGFWNLDHLEKFQLTEFAPLYDEITGGLAAGIRFWQIDGDKPLRATLYEMDGYTEYIKKKDGDMSVLKEKQTYKQNKASSELLGTEILDGDNYPGFPIVPLWGNPHHQSELVGLRQSIDAYDLIKSGFANDLDDASMIYWTLENAGGMDDLDLARFVERMKTVRAAVVDGNGGAKAEAHTMEVPYASRVAYLERLEQDMYNDYQALNVTDLQGGQKTATEINAAYQPFDNKVDQFEYCVLEFLRRLFAIAGIQDNPTFKRSRIVNQLEETQMVMLAAEYLDDETLLNHLPWLTPEEVKAVLDRRAAEELDRLGGEENDPETAAVPTTEEAVDTAEEAVGKPLNGSQTESLLSIVRQVQAGTLTEEQAASILATSIGVTKEEAKAILRGK